MSERDLLEQTANAILADHCSVERVDAVVADGWDPQLWSALETSGLTELSLSEGTLTDAAIVLRLTGYHAAMVPLGETLLLGGWVQQQLGLPLTAVSTAGRVGARIPYGRIPSIMARSVGNGPDSYRSGHDQLGGGVVVDSAGVVRLAEVEVLGTNVAHEPRDLMRPVGDPIGALDADGLDELALRAALLRTIQLSGAAERALDLTVKYVTERVQFGRTISKFQAVQQAVAVMAAEVAVMRAAADAAVGACERDGVAASRFPIAAAKTQASQAAGEVAKIAHQMHGAIGFTYEHSLRFSTTRLWAWRDEAGNESEWSAVVGGCVRTAGGAQLWPLIVGS